MYKPDLLDASLILIVYMYVVLHILAIGCLLVNYMIISQKCTYRFKTYIVSYDDLSFIYLTEKYHINPHDLYLDSDNACYSKVKSLRVRSQLDILERASYLDAALSKAVE